jgi:exosortase
VRLGADTRSRADVGATVVGGATVGLAVLYEPVMRELVRRWLEAPYETYGALVPLFTACLLWARRRSVRATPAAWRPEGLVVMAAAFALFALGGWLGSLSVQTLSLPPALAGLSLLALGRRRTRALAAPLAFTALMTPLPPAVIAAVSAALQHAEARVAHVTLRALGIPATLEGLDLRLGDAVLHVPEAGDGLHFLLIMLVAGAACAWATRMRLSQRALVVANAGALAILASLVRVSGTALLASAQGVDVAMGVQLAYGTLTHALALAAFLAGVAMVRRRARSAVRRGPRAPRRVPGTPLGDRPAARGAATATRSARSARAA